MSVGFILMLSYSMANGANLLCPMSTDGVSGCVLHPDVIIAISYLAACTSFVGAILLLVQNKKGLYCTAAGISGWIVLSLSAQGVTALALVAFPLAFGFGLGWAKISHEKDVDQFQNPVH